MRSKGRFYHIWQEILCHAPFTIGGALVGIIFMLIFKNMGSETGGKLFSVFHPAHVLLSAMVTTSLFAMHTQKKNILTFLVVGYVGSIGIATLSDSVIPFFGEEIMGVSVPTHAVLHEMGHGSDKEHELTAGDEASVGNNHSSVNVPVDHDDHEHEVATVHDDHEHEVAAVDHDHIEGEECLEHDHTDHSGHDHGKGLHLGFIEEWYIVNPAALAGIAIAWFIPRSRYPHALHILMSTWASSSHMLMNTQADISIAILFGMFIVLLIAVWLPCCISDIVFPLLFASGDIENSCRCSGSHHHHHKILSTESSDHGSENSNSGH